jgi:hypothetical protein
VSRKETLVLRKGKAQNAVVVLGKLEKERFVGITPDMDVGANAFLTGCKHPAFRGEIHARDVVTSTANNLLAAAGWIFNDDKRGTRIDEAAVNRGRKKTWRMNGCEATEEGDVHCKKTDTLSAECKSNNAVESERFGRP